MCDVCMCDVCYIICNVLLWQFFLIIFRAAVKLIACFSEELTLNAIKLIGKVLHHASQK